MRKTILSFFFIFLLIFPIGTALSASLTENEKKIGRFGMLGILAAYGLYHWSKKANKSDRNASWRKDSRFKKEDKNK